MTRRILAMFLAISGGVILGTSLGVLARTWSTGNPDQWLALAASAWLGLACVWVGFLAWVGRKAK